MTRELLFVDFSTDNFIDCLVANARPASHVLMLGEDPIGDEIITRASSHPGIAIHRASPWARTTPEFLRTALDQADIVLIASADRCQVSNMLLQLIEFEGLVVAARTEHHFEQRPVFLTSIPKSGTHLVSRVLEAMGLRAGFSETLPAYDEKPWFEPGNFYHISHATPDFFAVPSYRIRGLVKAMAGSILLFNYRDPRDIALSLSHWLVRRTQFHLLNGYLRSLDEAERLHAVITGQYPIPIAFGPHLTHHGDIREFVMRYAPWLQYPLPNQISLRFEDLCGTSGGGTLEAQLRTIWAMQLSLHRPGQPSNFCQDLFSSESKTFRSGQLASHAREFDARHHDAIASLPSDFLELFAYVPGQKTSFHREPSRFLGELQIGGEQEARMIVNGYRNYSIVEFNDAIYGIAQHLGEFRFDDVDPALVNAAHAEGHLFEASSVREVQELIDARVRNS